MDVLDSSFPIGASLANGRFEIASELFGTVDRGLYLATGDAPAIVTIGTEQEGGVEVMAARLVWSCPGIAELLWSGSIEGEGGRYDVIVEAQPSGQPLASWSGDHLSVSRIALALARMLKRAHKRSIVLGGLRPELIYVDGDDICVVPRSQLFHANMRPPCYGVPPCFEELYLAPSQAAARSLEPADDIFSLGATLAFVLTGAPPFAGESTMEILVAILEGRHRPLEGAGELAPLVERMLSVDPLARPSLDEIIERLT